MAPKLLSRQALNEQLQHTNFMGSTQLMDPNDSYFGYLVGNVQIGLP